MAARSEEGGVWLIAGPTASGKSALALALAGRTGGEIVNADSLQLYRDLRVLSARPDAADLAHAPHHLYGIADAAEAWSVGRWLRAALPVLEAVHARGRPAIVVGGTGLYFAALTRGLAQTPPVPEAVRDAVAARFDEEGEAIARAELRGVDPDAETRIAPGDRQRLVRALAVAQATGRPLSAWRAQTRPALASDRWRGLVLEPSRERLYAACDARFDAMLAAGALAEARALLARNLAPDLPAMKAVGLRELGRHLAGEIPLAEAAELARRETRRYAKRQLTWFRNQAADWPRMADADAALRFLA
ncbi:MAG: tRNA (adenosine(37)-N6)-dimethylallyltransferase MiaA [Caulobacteraceae bacterium]|nr:tRNA (adenosine(37)-N6)-dimethylallyltransferase MiaA [Caulobacter sp.]